MKNLKKVLALVLAVVMIMGVVTVASAKTYKDADAEAFKNYADAIDALSSLKILDGFKDGDSYSFKAEDPFTRAQAAKIVAIVHNAATNGAIKDQDAISGLYSNAQNPFVDCNTSWALPFINYCRITGLADGMTATTYEPNRYVTGVQFLKLMLTTLNFDTAKEGYTGTGWDINVLNRANEIGLTAGLKDGWKAIAPITRGEAAQVLYNALTKYLVEYGQKVKYNIDSDNRLTGTTEAGKITNWYKTYGYSFISNEQVSASGYTLAGKMGISIERATDDFRRPGYNWSYGSWSAFYMDKPVNSYTTAVTMCDILKNDMKVAETSDKAVKLNGWYKGITDADATDATSIASELKVDGKSVAYTALNYYAVDGFKYGSTATNEADPGVTLRHDDKKQCQTDRGTGWRNHQFGGQGDLTQVFKTEDGWVITTIHSFLANVEKVYLNGKYSHATGEKADLKVWTAMSADGPVYTEIAAAPKITKNVTFKAGTKVIVTMTLKKSEIRNNARMWDDAAVVDVAAAEAKTGKLTGASDYTYPETVSIDDTKYNTNCRFVLGKDAAMNIKNDGKTYTFYFDSYGNVIGRVDNTTAASYVVMDRIYGVHENGKFALKADLYDLDGKAIEAATVALAGSFASAKDGYDLMGNYAEGHTYSWGNWIFMVDSHNDSNLTNSLYSYTVNDKGAYTLTWVGNATSNEKVASTADDIKNEVTYGPAFSRVDGNFVHTAKMAYLRGTVTGTLAKVATDKVIENVTVDNVNYIDIALSESTKILVKSAGGEWTSYTGYTALPALSASYVDYLDNDGDGFADIVYIGKAVFAADNVTGWVLKWTPFNWAKGYDLITVYVDGEPVTVNVKHSTIIDGTDSANQELHPGLYTFRTQVDTNGVTYSEFYKEDETASQYHGEAVESYSADATSIKIKVSKDGTQYTQTVGLSNVVIYNVLADGTVVKADASCIAAGDWLVYSNVNDKYAAPYAVIYVLDNTIPYNP